ncbi:hypothetical protein M407DRAFT_11650 [Tulasnella calospora MUT 4182]|uniref:O-methyltransferase dimerisation domain-containing protein n=1 Tax=Tulasnella calospora MUT 4182 TaxID=1051891 RepID=A0A0C3PVE7_9AGAM|nr:hypothetical protein M407DRAFT_11650 [Tulasnella calospora MUT 4182]
MTPDKHDSQAAAPGIGGAAAPAPLTSLEIRGRPPRGVTRKTGGCGRYAGVISTLALNWIASVRWLAVHAAPFTWPYPSASSLPSVKAGSRSVKLVVGRSSDGFFALALYGNPLCELEVFLWWSLLRPLQRYYFDLVQNAMATLKTNFCFETSHTRSQGISLRILVSLAVVLHLLDRRRDRWRGENNCKITAGGGLHFKEVATKVTGRDDVAMSRLVVGIEMGQVVESTRHNEGPSGLIFLSYTFGPNNRNHQIMQSISSEHKEEAVEVRNTALSLDGTYSFFFYVPPSADLMQFVHYGFEESGPTDEVSPRPTSSPINTPTFSEQRLFLTDFEPICEYQTARLALENIRNLSINPVQGSHSTAFISLLINGFSFNFISCTPVVDDRIAAGKQIGCRSQGDKELRGNFIENFTGRALNFKRSHPSAIGLDSTSFVVLHVQTLRLPLVSFGPSQHSAPQPTKKTEPKHSPQYRLPMALVMPPGLLLQTIAMGYELPMVLGTVNDLGIAEILSQSTESGGRMSSKDIEARCGVPASKVSRFFRFLASRGIFEEVDQEVWTHTEASRLLDSGLSSEEIARDPIRRFAKGTSIPA